jgi:hypothetical protein
MNYYNSHNKNMSVESDKFYDYCLGYQTAVKGLDQTNDDYNYLLGYTDGEESILEFGIKEDE